MNRRDFLTRLGLTVAAVQLSPLLDLAPILEPPSLVRSAHPFWSATLSDKAGLRPLTLDMIRSALDALDTPTGELVAYLPVASVEMECRYPRHSARLSSL